MVDVLPNPDDSGKDLGVFAIADALPQTFDPAGNNTRSRRCANRTPGGGATFTNAFTGRLQRGRRLLAIPVVEPVVARGKAIDGGRRAAQGL